MILPVQAGAAEQVLSHDLARGESVEYEGKMMNKAELLASIKEIFDKYCEDPGQQMIDHGEALIAIGKALKGQSFRDARAIIESVQRLEL